MRLIIAGTQELHERRAGNFERLVDAVMKACPGGPPSQILGGGEVGPAMWGAEIAKQYGIEHRRFLPDFQVHGAGAEALCNGDMVVHASQVEGSKLVAVWDGSSASTRQLMDTARTYGLEVVVVFSNATIHGSDTAPPAPFIFTQSYSSISLFETCPRQYHARYITKEVKWTQSPEALWGDQVHNALERYLITNGAAGLPGNMAQYKRWADWILQRAAKRGGVVMAERQAAVTKDRKATGYRDKAGWIRGKIDVTIKYPDGTAETFDWKTGKVKNDMTQLKLYDGFTFADYPDVEVVKSGYIWLAHEQVSPPAVLTRDQAASVWDEFDHKYLRLVDAYTRDTWNPRPSGLCKKYCDVVTCIHNGRHSQ